MTPSEILQALFVHSTRRILEEEKRQRDYLEERRALRQGEPKLNITSTGPVGELKNIRKIQWEWGDETWDISMQGEVLLTILNNAGIDEFIVGLSYVEALKVFLAGETVMAEGSLIGLDGNNQLFTIEGFGHIPPAFLHAVRTELIEEISRRLDA